MCRKPGTGGGILMTVFRVIRALASNGNFQTGVPSKSQRVLIDYIFDIRFASDREQD